MTTEAETIYGLQDLRPGDIGFGPIHGKVGVAIRAALAIVDGGAPYQHVFILTEASRLEHDFMYPAKAVEAMPGGAREVDIGDRWTQEYCYVRPDYKDEAQANAVALDAIHLIKTPYSDLDYYAIGAHHLHLPSKLVDNYIKSSKHMICSQLVDKVLTDNGWHPFNDNRLPQDVTPSAFFNVLDRRLPRLQFAYPM
jgi:hypothetical protein